jgi:large conductance mechanosensitive channel
MGIFSEFKDFAMKGNLVDMAVGFIMGVAFKTVITALVDNIFMPIIGNMMGGTDFSQLFVDLTGGGYQTLAAAEEAGAAVIKHGAFIQALIDFLIIAFVVFIMVKVMNKWQKAKEEAPAEPSEDILLLREIRDNLKK